MHYKDPAQYWRCPGSNSYIIEQSLSYIFIEHLVKTKGYFAMKISLHSTPKGVSIKYIGLFKAFIKWFIYTCTIIFYGNSMYVCETEITQSRIIQSSKIL